MKVYAFDRDSTIDVNKGPVPLEWVQKLTQTEHEVWAIGNQRLKEEANIPGIAEILARLGIERNTTPPRRERVDMLREVFPEAEEYIVVDDVDLSDMEGWTYYTPEDFVDKFRDRLDWLEIDVPTGD